MKKIASFMVNHLKLVPGLYVSRKDKFGTEFITTFDIRMTSPNDEPVMNTAEVHTIEHLGATFLRNHPEFAEKTVYFGPMGCRTGFYLLLAGDYSSEDILPETFQMPSSLRTIQKLTGVPTFYKLSDFHNIVHPVQPALGVKYSLSRYHMTL